MGDKDWVRVPGYEVRVVAPSGDIVFMLAPQPGEAPAELKAYEGQTIPELAELGADTPLQAQLGTAAREEARKHARPRHPGAVGERLDRPNARLEILTVETLVAAE